MTWHALNLSAEFLAEQQEEMANAVVEEGEDVAMSEVHVPVTQQLSEAPSGTKKLTKAQKQELAKEDAVKKCIMQFEDAMQLYRDEKHQQALEIFEKLLQEPIIKAGEVGNEDNLMNRLVFVLCKNAAELKLSLSIAHDQETQNTIRDTVIDLYVKALQVDSSDTDSWLILGRLFRKKRMFSNAIQCFKCGMGPIDLESPLRLHDPASLQCLRQLVVTYFAIGDLDNCYLYCRVSVKCDSEWEFAKRFVADRLVTAVTGKSIMEKLRALDAAGVTDDSLIEAVLSKQPIHLMDIGKESIYYADFDGIEPRDVAMEMSSHKLLIPERSLGSIVETLVRQISKFADEPRKLFELLNVTIPEETSQIVPVNAEPEPQESTDEPVVENDKDDSTRASSRLQKMLGTVDKSQDKKFALLAGIDNDLSLEEQFDNKFPIHYNEKTFEPILGYSTNTISSQDRELCLGVPRRILFIYLKGLLRQSQAAKLRKRQRRDAKPGSDKVVSIKERWDRFISNRDYEDTIAVEEFVLQISGLNGKVNVFDYRSITLSAILKQFVATGDKFVKEHMAAIFLETVCLGFGDDVCEVDIANLELVLKSVAGSKDSVKLHIELLEYTLETLRKFFEGTESIELENDAKISALRTALDFIMSTVQVSLQCNLGADISEFDLRFWYCCAQFELFFSKTSPKFVQFIRKCIGIMENSSTLSSFENSIGQRIDLSFLEGELYLMKAKLFLDDINTKIAEKRLPSEQLALLEAVIFGHDFPSNNAIPELPNISLKNAVCKLSISKVIDIARSFLEYYKSTGNSELLNIRRVEIVNKIVSDLFKSNRLITLFVEEWKYVNLEDPASFEFGEHFEIASEFMKVILKVFRFIKDIKEESPSDIALIYGSLCNMLMFSWDFLHRSNDIRKHISNIHEEYDYFSEFEHIKSAYNVARDFYSYLSIPWHAFYAMQFGNKTDVDEVQRTELLLHIHDVLGEHGLCRTHDVCLPKLIIDRCKSNLSDRKHSQENIKQFEDGLFQAYYCLYGVRVTTESMNDLHDHEVFYDSITLDLDEAKTFETFLDLQKYLSSRSERKDTHDTMKQFEVKIQADMERLMTENEHVFRNDAVIREYMDRDLLPSVSLKADFSETPVHLQTIKNASVSEVHFSFHLLKGTILLQNALKMPISVETARKQTRIDTLLSASEAFIADLRISPNRWKSWYYISLCYHTILDEYLSWPPHSIQYFVKEIAQLQRKSFRSLTKAIDLLSCEASSVHTLTNLIVLYSELGYLVYSMISKPLSGIICYNYYLSKQELSRYNQKLDDELSDVEDAAPLKRKHSETDHEKEPSAEMFEFPKTIEEAQKLIVGVDKKIFIAFTGSCFTKCRKLFKHLSEVFYQKFGHKLVESYEWCFMLGKCSEKLQRDPLLALKYYKAAINLSCPDWNVELSSPVTTRSSSPLESNKDIIFHFKDLFGKETPLEASEELVTSVLSAFSSWRWNFTQPSPTVSIDPLYKYVSLLMKIYLHYPVDPFGIVEKHVNNLGINLAGYTIDLWPGYDESSPPQSSMAMLLTIANLIMRYDKWYHRIIYRTSWFLRQLIHPVPVVSSNNAMAYFTNTNDWQSWATTESHATILQLFQLKTKLTNIWRTAFERSGKYNMYTRDYVALLVDILGISRDYENLFAFIKRKLKYSDIFWSKDIWAAACDMYSLSFCEEVNAKLQLIGESDCWWNIINKINKKIVAKCVPILENALTKEIEILKSNKDLLHVRLKIDTTCTEDLFDILKRIVEARKLVGSSVFDQYLSKIYSYILIRKALIESWLSQRFREYSTGNLLSRTEDQETIVEIDKNLSALIFWLFEELKSHGIESEPHVNQLEMMLRGIIKTQAQSFLKSSVINDNVDEWFLVLKALALSKNQKFFKREKGRSVTEEDVPEDEEQHVEEIQREDSPTAEGSSTFGIIISPAK